MFRRVYLFGIIIERIDFKNLIVYDLNTVIIIKFEIFIFEGNTMAIKLDKQFLLTITANCEALNRY